MLLRPLPGEATGMDGMFQMPVYMHLCPYLYLFRMLPAVIMEVIAGIIMSSAPGIITGIVMKDAGIMDIIIAGEK